MDKQTFIKTIANEAKAICLEKGYGYAQFATCVSQSCCETGYGRSTIMVNNFAAFGIKATKGWLSADSSRKCYNARTGECYDGVNYVNINACFRAYDSFSESVRDYFDLLSAKRYCESLKAKTVKDAITIIKNGGYATSPTYVDTILKFYAEIKQLIDNIWGNVYNKDEDVKVYYPTIRMGTCAGKSQVVKTLQTMLNLFGYHIPVDGSWGQLTNAAVLDFQRTHKDVNGVQLVADGCAGPLTWGALQKGV